MSPYINRALLSFPVGFLGGSICGFFILSFGALIGKSGNTGCEYIGYWSLGYLLLATMYGGPLGFLFFPLGHALFLGGIPSSRLITLSWKIATFTIIGGCIGAIRGPIEAVPCGLVGFFVGCIFYARKKCLTGSSS